MATESEVETEDQYSDTLIEPIQKWIDQTRLFESLSELHGLVTGLICSQSAPATQSDASIDALLNGVNACIDEKSETLSSEISEPLLQLIQKSLTSIKSSDFSFQLILPAAASPIKERVSAIAEWAQGFLYGFGAAAPKGRRFSPEANELLQDLAEISRLSLGTELEGAELSEKEREEAEASLFEVTEHVRLAVISLFLEPSTGEKQK